MLRINQLNCTPDVQGEQLERLLRKKAEHLLGCKEKEILSLEIIRCSIDARKKPVIFYSYTVDVQVEKRESVYLKKKYKPGQVQQVVGEQYHFPKQGKGTLTNRPVVVGTGPCGLFAGYLLALHGYQPILLERGKPVEERMQDVEAFWQGGRLLTESNVQFGEGGAGTFSDGKLNTLVKDKDGRNRYVLEAFVKAGAPKQILYDAKPHIGTDILQQVVRNMRNTIIKAGGEFRFQSKMTDLKIEQNRLVGVELNHEEWLPTQVCILAIGHSARDTYEMLLKSKIPMEAKSFAVGLRVEHPQKLINYELYGVEESEILPTASYKLTAKTGYDRGVYSFCMCPGGYVVNASSEEGRVAVNGMSYSGRDSANANSAVIVSVSPKDYPGDGPLAGVLFQRELEEKAYEAGKGAVPVETYGDFKRAVLGTEATENTERSEMFDSFSAVHKGEFVTAPVHEIMTEEMNRAFIEGMEHFGNVIKGFNHEKVLLTGVESRTSSPVRILRNDSLECEIKGIYPCGEGAGFAGGIMSAAMDGMRAAEAVAKQYQSIEPAVKNS